MNDITQKRVVILVFALMALIGLITAPDYGQPCDEPAEMVILRENILEYSNRISGPESDISLYLLDEGITPVSLSIERDHGQSAYYPAAPLLLLGKAFPTAMTHIWHMYTFLIFMLGVISLYLTLMELNAGRAASLLTALVMYMTPRMFAEGHYNNKDMALLSLVLVTICLGARFLRRGGFGRGAAFSIAAAFAANTKLIGLWAWGVMCLAVLIRHLARRTPLKTALPQALCVIASFAVSYALLTPAMWGDPAGYLRYLVENTASFTRWWGVVIFRGARFAVGENPLPRYYLPYMMLVTTPAFALALTAFGQISVIVNAVRAKTRPTAARVGADSISARPAATTVATDDSLLCLIAVSLIWLVPVCYAILARTLIYNGWRHFYFAYGPMMILAGYGVSQMGKLLKTRALKRAGAIALCACLAAAGVDTALNHPYQFAYYSPLLRGERLGTDYELDYWNLSVMDCIEELYESVGPLPDSPITVAGADPLTALGLYNSMAVMPRHVRESFVVTDAESAEYIMSNPTYALIYQWNAEGMEKVCSVYAYGQSIMDAYQVASK